MIEIYFIACLVSNPAQCREKALSYSDMTELTCNARSQSEAAQWSVLHPGWKITRYGCRPVGLMSKA